MKTTALQAFLMLAVVLLTLQFKTHLVPVAGKVWFNNFANKTESFVLGRLAYSEQNGILSEGALLGSSTGAPEGVAERNYQYTVYFESIPIKSFWLYKTPPALHSLIFTSIDAISPFTNRQNHQFFLWMCSFFTAAIFTWFLWWVAQTFGFFPAGISLLSILLSPWLVVSGGHLYWVFGSLLLPLVTGLHLHHKERQGKTIGPWLFFIATTLGVLTKCLINGYEIVTSICVLATIPVFFYAILDKWSFRRFATRFMIVAAGAIFAVLISVGVLVKQIDSAPSSNMDGVTYLKERFFIRSKGEFLDQNQAIPERIKESQVKSYSQILKRYLNEGAFYYQFGKDGGRHKINFQFFLILLVVLTLAQLLYFKDNLMKTLVASSYIGLLGPLSWIVIFKSHSYLHVHLNSLFWYLPFMLFLYVGYAYAGKLVWLRAQSFKP
ncbi:MAG: hypothetical protein DRR42_14040 [Gammaproteobacteria bacterium]|nr:MAG: hypothetical protein DRR42_14040 [Gammaproteobacteria bacterium]